MVFGLEKLFRQREPTLEERAIKKHNGDAVKAVMEVKDARYFDKHSMRRNYLHAVDGNSRQFFVFSDFELEALKKDLKEGQNGYTDKISFVDVKRKGLDFIDVPIKNNPEKKSALSKLKENVKKKKPEAFQESYVKKLRAWPLRTFFPNIYERVAKETGAVPAARTTKGECSLVFDNLLKDPDDGSLVHYIFNKNDVEALVKEIHDKDNINFIASSLPKEYKIFLASYAGKGDVMYEEIDPNKHILYKKTRNKVSFVSSDLADEKKVNSFMLSSLKRRKEDKGYSLEAMKEDAHKVLGKARPIFTDLSDTSAIEPKERPLVMYVDEGISSIGYVVPDNGFIRAHSAASLLGEDIYFGHLGSGFPEKNGMDFFIKKGSALYLASSVGLIDDGSIDDKVYLSFTDDLKTRYSDKIVFYDNDLDAFKAYAENKHEAVIGITKKEHIFGLEPAFSLAGADVNILDPSYRQIEREGDPGSSKHVYESMAIYPSSFTIGRMKGQKGLVLIASDELTGHMAGYMTEIFDRIRTRPKNPQ